MKKETWSIIGNTILGVVELISLTILMVLDKIPMEIGIGMMGIIAGLWGVKGMNGGNKTPPSGLIATLGGPLLHAMDKIKILLLIAIVLPVTMLHGCATASQTVDTLDRLTSQINPMVTSIEGACISRELDVMINVTDPEDAKRAIDDIRAECDALHDAYIAWYNAYEMVLEAIDSDDKILISRALQAAIARSSEFIRVARRSTLMQREEQ